jgi:hypothetical protein
MVRGAGDIDGIVYLTNKGLSFSNGTLTSPDYFGLVVDTFALSGATFTIQGNYSGSRAEAHTGPAWV